MKLFLVICAALTFGMISSVQSESLVDHAAFHERYPKGTDIAGTNELTKKYIEAQIEYDMATMKHRLWTFWTQYIMSIVIFVTVIGVVSFGMKMSYAQFKESSKDPSNITKLKIGPYGLEVSTSVVGVIVLVISAFFFYLYILAVFPISEVPVVNASG